VQFICSILTSLGLIAFLLVIFVYGVKLVGTGLGQVTPSLQISIQMPYLSLPVGAGLMLFHSVAQLARSLWGRVG